ncbi:hypothetical protein OPV22_016131 [Ensete ventricosum]|uniref:Uncharacterized protein n=1 Tax=Ensete ventricosum TaxID=4639 RepID=A0AAV8QPM8_ENSVE|nr:hypothetical protein OPV22_016131 [Ensete ventricosum]
MEAICCLPAALPCIRPRHPTRSLCLAPLLVRHFPVSLSHVPLEEDHRGRAWGVVYFGAATTTARGSGRRVVVMMMANGGGSPGNGAAQGPTVMQTTLDFLRATLSPKDYSTGQEVAQRMKVALSKICDGLQDDPTKKDNKAATKNGFGSEDLYMILLSITQIYIALKDYGMAKEVCKVALATASPNDARPRLLMVIINMMLMVENLLWTTQGFGDPKMKELMSDAAEHWEECKNLEVMDLGSTPPDHD